jgi:hypothetical protein
MKKNFLTALVLAGAFLFAFCFPETARAQFTTVTATVTDPNGIPYAGAVMNAILVPGAAGGYTLNGAPYSGRVGPATLDSTGKFTANFGDVTLITPGSPQWQITIDSNPGGILPPFGTGSQTFTYTSTGTTISGGSPVNISSSLNALAPKLTNITLGAGTVTSFSAGNLSPLFTTSVATATTTPALSFAQTTQTANQIFAGPGSGAAANPTFRSLVAADLPVTPTVLDCSQQAGADMGAKLNACLAALPAAGGIADATKFSSPQTISTAVTDSISAVILTCAITINQSATVTLSGTNSAWIGCFNQSTIVNKTGNINQVTISGNNVAVENLTLAGNRTFTLNGIQVAHGALFTIIKNNSIHLQSGSCINDLGGLAEGWDSNSCFDFGTSAYTLSGGAIVPQAANMFVSNAGADNSAAVFNISGASTLNVSESSLSPSGAFPIFSTSGNSVLRIVDDQVQNVSSRPIVNATGGTLVISHSLLIGGGFSGQPAITTTANSYIHDNSITCTTADCIDITGAIFTIENNRLGITSSATDEAAIRLTGTVIGANIHSNSIGIFGTGVANTYGIWMQATAGGGQMSDSNITDNIINGNSVPNADGFFFDNTIGDPNANVNIIAHTQCFLTAICIKRTDPAHLLNIYEDEISNGTTAFSGGSTVDVLFQPAGSFTFATLPIAGNSSLIYCTDCTATTPTAGSGTGAFLTRILVGGGGTGGVWSGGAINAAGQVNGATYATATNCSSSASPAVCGSAAAGSVALPTNAVSSSIVVNTTAVTANSQIFAFADDTLGTKLSVTCNSTVATLVGGLTISARTAGTSFTIANNVAVVTNPLCLSYHIIN